MPSQQFLEMDLVYLDFAKAFDKVSHSKLLFKINTVFKDPNLTKWFTSYLQCRQQYVQINEHTSSLEPVLSGVPQGSVLGPLLFLIFINDLPHNISVPIRLFADDCVAYNTIESPSDQIKLQCSLENIMKWCSDWQMVINPNKSVSMSITRKKKILQFPYSIHGKKLKKVEEHKYLGLLFRSDLSWNRYVEEVSKKANNALWSLRRNLQRATTEVKNLAYRTLVRPIIEYAKIVWDPYTEKNRKKLERIQRLASRFIFNKYGRHHSPSKLCQLANLPNLELRTKYDRIKFLFLIIHNEIKINRTNYFEISTNESSRHRHSMYIPPPVTRNDTFKYSFFPRTIKEWNMLPDFVVQSASLNNFLSNLHAVIYSESVVR